MSASSSGKNLPIRGNRPTRRRNTARACIGSVAVLFAFACSPADTPPPPRPDVAHPFDTQRAWRDLERIVAFGPRPAGSASLKRLREYLVEQLTAAGLEPVQEAFSAPTPIGSIDFVNVYADLPGTTPDASRPDAPVVVLGSHYDTKRLPFEFVGANDGGSSTAVLLELARQLVASGRERRVTYRFLFLDGEEAVRPDWDGLDNRYGSRHHVDMLLESGEIRRITAFVLLDLVGDADLRINHDLTSTRELLVLVWNAARRLGLERHVGARAKEIADDHLSFLEVGVPSVDLIDLEFGPDNSWWHSPDDTLENCSPDSLAAIGQIVLEALPEIEAYALGARAAPRPKGS